MKKLTVFVGCLLPLFWELYQLINNQLGPDLGEELVLYTGIWALRFLLISLSITPIRKWLAYSLVRYRRMLGLYAWFYGSLHLLCILTYVLGWSWMVFIEEFAERPYMALGISAWLLMLPLGLSSNRWAIKLLGRKWKLLHQLVYVVGILACCHFIWLVRSEFIEPILYSSLLIVLLMLRLPTGRKALVESS